MKKIIALLLVLIMCAGLISACSDNAATNPTPTPAATPTPATTPEQTPDQSEPEFIDFTDSVGRTVEVPSNVKRVSPTGAMAQMYLLAIAPDLMVTISSEYTSEQVPYVPDYVTLLPVVGQFYGSADLNLETIASVNPEIVIDVGEPKNTVVDDMDEITVNTAIPAVHITATIDSTPDAFRMLGKLLGREEKGEVLAQFCEKILAQTDGVMAKVGDNKARALYLTGDTGQNVIAATSYHAEMFDYLVDNIAVVDSPSSRGTGNETDLEQITIWNPDYIIFSPQSVYGSVADDPTWKELAAISSGNYVETPFGPYNWFGNPPSINRYLLMIWLPTVLYPEYADYDCYGQIKEYYDLFYGHDLTEAQYEALTVNAFIK